MIATGPAVDRAPDLAVPLPYLAAGVAGFALFAALLPLAAPALLTTVLHPQVLALVHLATLGWFTMVARARCTRCSR